MVDFFYTQSREIFLFYNVSKNFERKTVNIFSSIHLNICYGTQKNRLNHLFDMLIETVLLSIHKICFG